MVNTRNSIYHTMEAWWRDTDGRQDSTVSIATCHGLDSAGFKSWWMLDFLYPSAMPQGQTCFLYNENCISFLEAQWPGLSVNNQPPPSIEVSMWSYSSTSPSIFKACYNVRHIHKCIHTHFVCGDLKTCVIQINQVRMVRTITGFRKLDISLVSRIMPMLNFTIHLNL